MANDEATMNTIGAPTATRREWIGLAVLALLCLLYWMDLNVLNLAVPHLTADLEPSSAQLLWIVDIYGFLIAGSLITMGTLGDRNRRRGLLLIGAAAFGAASILAAFSFTASMLIGARAILGAASATLAPSTVSLLRTCLPESQFDNEGLLPEFVEFMNNATAEDIGDELRDAYVRVAPRPGDWPRLVAKVAKLNAEFKGWRAEDVQSISVPRMLVIGDRDIVRPEHAIARFRLLRDSQLTILPGTDHES